MIVSSKRADSSARTGPNRDGSERALVTGCVLCGGASRRMGRDKAEVEVRGRTLLARAIEEAGSADDVVAIANALEGMEHDSIWGGSIYMRPEDHQAIQNVHIMAHTDEGITHDSDNSGYGLVVESTVDMAALDGATSCKMKRP